MNTTQSIARLKARGFEWPIPWEAVELIARKESCVLKAYLCPVGKPTIGWGETEGVHIGMEWDEDTADRRFFNEICQYTMKVVAQLTTPPNDNQLGAMVSLSYNIGLGAFSKSTVRKAHNKGDYSAAARAFNLWNKGRVNGVLTVLGGLVSRRAAEAALYLKPEDHAPETPNVQAVEAETPLTGSPIVKSGATTTALGGLAGATALLGDATPIIEQAKNIATSFNVNPLMVLGGVLLVVGLRAVYWRWKQRDEGWA